MCGFLGERGKISDREVFKGLLDLSVSRGPDDQQIVEPDAGIRFGFNRLSILDLSDAGRQPMFSIDGRWLVMLNGELYNHLDLQAGLSRTDWRGHSDTETLTELIRVHGFHRAIALLDGMFAVAAWDLKERNLYLARDFAGIKPFFWGQQNGCFVFGSQYDQVKKHPEFQAASVNPRVLKLYLKQHFVPAPFGLHEGISQLLPGEIMRLAADFSIERTRYWKLPSRPQHTIFEKKEALEAVEKTFEKCVHAQMLSDVSLGAFLSGGVDSPLVCAFAKRKDPGLKVFTIGSDSALHDESERAAAYADSLSLQQELLRLDDFQMQKYWGEAMASLHEPLADFSILPTYLVSKLARRSASVALSGDGGDELFFGYERFWSVGKNIRYQQWPLPVKKLLYGLDKMRTGNRKINSGVLSSLQGRAHEGLHSRFADRQISAVLPEMKSVVFPDGWNVYDYENSSDQRTLLGRMRQAEFYGMMQKTLRKVDLASMENGLEVRVPFLQKSMIETAVSIDPFLSYGDGRRKDILKKSLGRLVPQVEDDNIKRGFSVPLGHWIRSGLKSIFQEHLLEGNLRDLGFCRAALEAMLKQHDRGEADHKWALFTLIVLEQQI